MAQQPAPFQPMAYAPYPQEMGAPGVGPPGMPAPFMVAPGMPAPMPNNSQLEEEMETYTPLQEKYYDVTNYVESGCIFINSPCLGWQTQKLLLGDQEATLRTKNCCVTNTQRRPYAQLGSVEKIEEMGMCHAFKTDLKSSQGGEGGENGMAAGAISPGFGCDSAMVDEIVREMQQRKLLRGNVMQIRKLDYMHNTIVKVAQTLPMTLKAVGVDYTPATPAVYDPVHVFPNKSYDMTNNCEYACGCCSTTKVELYPDEVHLLRTNCCSNFVQKREYVQLGYVNKMKSCICCRAVASDMGQLMPGCGCSGSKVSEVVEEMRERMYARGAVGQIRKQEKMLKQLVEIEKEISILCYQLGVQYPPTEATLTQIYGGAIVPNMMVPPLPPVSVDELSKQFPDKHYDVTNYCDSMCTLCCTLGTAGWTKETMDLKDDVLINLEKNNFDSSDIKNPYGQLESVDYTRACFCCYSVGTAFTSASPGCGCSKAKVMEIAAELQARKVARGNIAQLHQLEWMQSTVLALDLKVDLLLNSQGAQFPPPLQIMANVYGPQPPRAVTHKTPTTHLDASQKFEHKTYDVTNYPGSCCITLGTCCLAGPMTTQTLDLEDEEMTLKTSNWCYTATIRRPYAQVTSVDVETAFCGLMHSLPEVAVPGCGCSKAMVDEISSELQERKVKRGDIAQLKIQQNVIVEVAKLSAKSDLLQYQLQNKSSHK